MKTWLLVPTLIVSLAAPVAAQDRTAEIERKLEALTQELAELKFGVADTLRAAKRFGFAPAAAKVYGAPRGVSIGGYGEFAYQALDQEDESGAERPSVNSADALRAIVYLGHKFTDALLFNSEIEFEHGGVDDAFTAAVTTDTTTGSGTASGALKGEAKLEFAYLDWMPSPSFGVRAGLLLMPVGFVNELHEPPVFFGARRPELERRVIPTTWNANGLGVFGETANGLSWRAYVTEPLDVRGFATGNPIRNGRQGGSRALMRHPAFVGRLDWQSDAGVLVGGSAYTGDAAQHDEALEARVTLLEAHGQWQWRQLQARALWAQGTLDDAGAVSDALGLAGTSRLGETFGGWYLEAGYDLVPHFAPGSAFALQPFARYEALDTQDDVPGGSESAAHERTIVTAGVSLKPHPNVVAKIDREFRSNEADNEVSQWNLAVGYLF